MIKINEIVPDFEADAYQNDDIKKIKLSDYRGKWVVFVFYPADFTFVCPTELEDAAAIYSEFQKINTEIISVSTDTAFAHKAWHDNSPAIAKVKYPMLGDPTGNVSRLFGVYIDNEGLALRGTFIIDPDGVLKTVEINSNNIGRNISETLRKLQAAQFVREHKDNVCPANWHPGETVLKPGPDLVGKI
ncbi:MAG: redoxin domain-containing protein [bacterium]|nr:redoxin domain-containing protein [bacterium]